jgi:hypothetical protein
MTTTPEATRAAPRPSRLVDLFEYGLDAPICLTWELTYACNLACTHCLSSSGRRDPHELSTVLLSPTGVQAVDPEGEVAVPGAAASRGVIMGLSSFAGRPVEEVTDAHPNVFFQLYWSGTRDTMVQRMDRARTAGAKALIVTLDWSFSHGRDWGSPAIPETLDLKTMLRFAPDVLPRPSGCGGSRSPAASPTSPCPTCDPRAATPPRSRRLDDLAYGAGVWFSAFKGRSTAALRLRIVR